MADIFLSYSRRDLDTARRYADCLAAEGFSVWWDATLRSGETWDELLEAALREAKAVIVLWSPQSVASRWVRAEATVADRKKTLLPVMIEACDRPIMFELTQTAELTGWQGDRQDKAWRAFVAEVAHFCAADPAAAPVAPPLTPALPPPPEPAPVVRGQHGEAPSLAVLPFANRSAVPEDEVFAVGMVEDLIDALSQSVNVRVVSRSATARFRTDAIFDLAAMARELGVRYILEGNIRRSGEVLRVAAQLVEAETGAILWTQKFERPLSELAMLEEELVLDVAANLDTQVYKVEMARVLKKPSDLTAWECCTRAVAAYRQVGVENLVLAYQEAARAVAIAPDYALAHAMLADAEATLYMWTRPDDPAEVRRIRVQIDKALALEPSNPMVLAHVAEAFNYIGQPKLGLEYSRRAVQLSPSFGLGHYTSGVANVLLDRIDAANACFDAELKVAPGSHILYASYIWRGAGHLRVRQWEKATDAYGEAIELNATAMPAHVGRAWAMHILGRHEEARAHMTTVWHLAPEMSLPAWQMLAERWFGDSPAAPEVLSGVTTLWNELEALTAHA